MLNTNTKLRLEIHLVAAIQRSFFDVWWIFVLIKSTRSQHFPTLNLFHGFVISKYTFILLLPTEYCPEGISKQTIRVGIGLNFWNFKSSNFNWELTELKENNLCRVEPTKGTFNFFLPSRREGLSKYVPTLKVKHGTSIYRNSSQLLTIPIHIHSSQL